MLSPHLFRLNQSPRQQSYIVARVCYQVRLVVVASMLNMYSNFSFVVISKQYRTIAIYM